jgi:hypothetical protein
MLNLNITVELNLTPKEFTLVRAVLGGRAHFSKETKALDDKLSQQFVTQMRQKAREVEKLAENMERAGRIELRS